MTVLFRELLGGWLVPRLTMRPAEQWSSGDLVITPKIQGDFSLQNVISAGTSVHNIANYELDLTEFDGLAVFTYVPEAAFIDTAYLRFHTVPGVHYFETQWTPQGGAATGGLYDDSGSLYDSARYSAGIVTAVWERQLVLKDNFAVIGTPSWADIRQVEMVGTAQAGGSTVIYWDAICGWHQADPADAGANTCMSNLPEYYWDEDLQRVLNQAIGYELDGLRGTIEHGLKQRFLQWATWGLRLHEQQHGLAVDPPWPEHKRRSLCGVFQNQAATPAEISALVSPLAEADIELTEHIDAYRVDCFVPVDDNTATRDRIKSALRQVIPAHIQVVVSYTSFVAGVGLAGTPLGAVQQIGGAESASLIDAGSKSP